MVSKQDKDKTLDMNLNGTLIEKNLTASKTAAGACTAVQAIVDTEITTATDQLFHCRPGWFFNRKSRQVGSSTSHMHRQAPYAPSLSKP